MKREENKVMPFCHRLALFNANFQRCLANMQHPVYAKLKLFLTVIHFSLKERYYIFFIA